MPTALLIALAVLYASLATAVAVAVHHHRQRVLITGRRVGTPVIVHTKDAQSIQGILFDVRDNEHLVLTQAEYVAGVKPAGVGGPVFIPWSNYSWRQELPVGALAAADTDGGG